MTEFATLSLMAGRGKVLTVRSCTSLRSSFDGRSVKTYFTAFSKLVALFLLFFFSFFAPMFVTFAPTFVAFAPMFVAFASTTKFAWEHHQKIQNPYRKSVHILGFSVTKGSPFYAICDVFVNTCEGRGHALNPLCLSDFRSRCEGWTLVSCFIRIREKNK